MARLTLYNRIEPLRRGVNSEPADHVSSMTFHGDMAVFWAAKPSENGDGIREARVVFGGMMYRFADVSENRTAMAEFMKGPTNEQSR